MKIKALRPLNGRYGQKQPGEQFNVGEALARSLIAKGVAERVAGPAPRLTGAASNPGPVTGPLAGSPTGAAEPASSSGVDPAPPRPASPRSRAARRPSS